MKTWIAVFFAVAIYPWGAFADSVELSSLTKDELSKLTEEQINSFPAIAFFKRVAELDPPKDGRGEKMVALMQFAIAQGLRDLYYTDTNPGSINDEELARATAAFQTQMKVEPTGVLTFGQFKQMTRFVMLSRLTDVTLPGLSSEPVAIYIDGGYASTEGRMEIDGDKIAWPINHHNVRCDKRSGYCTDFETVVATPGDSMGKDNDWYILNTSTTDYWIMNWNDVEVIAEQKGDCRTTTLTLNKASKEVLFVTRNGTGTCSDPGFKLKTPRTARLVQGYEFSRAFFKDLKREGWRHYNPVALEMMRSVGIDFEK